MTAAHHMALWGWMQEPDTGEEDPMSGIFLGMASLAAQLLRNPPAMQETPVRFWGWKDNLEKG